MDKIEQLINQLPSIPVRADNIRVIETPQQFYQTLIELTKQAKKRIVLSTLYLGNGTLEQNLVDELEKALRRCPQLRMNILLDYLRGTRDGHQSSVALLRRLLPQASVHLFHTPHLRGILRHCLPERMNEIVGLQHMKLYIFDDSIVISGANLSESYFTNRQDRYLLIEDSPQLVDFFSRLIDAVCSCSFSLQSDGTIHLNEQCSVHPYQKDLNDYVDLIRGRLDSVLRTLPEPENLGRSRLVNVSTLDTDTRVYPLIQMGMFGLNQENDFLVQLFSSQDTSSKLVLTSGYFNLIDDYEKLISKKGAYSMDVLYASPQANGFYNGSGLSTYIPSLYVVVSELFFRLKRPQINLYEYHRPGWTYHAKGLWIESKQSTFWATLVGSSNYGYRSVHRDLEAQLLIVTSNEHLKRRLCSEHNHLMEWSTLVDGSTFVRADHFVPRWVRLFARYIRNFF